MRSSRKFLIVLVMVIALVGGTDASAGLWGPANFDECMTDAMKGVKSDEAARHIEQACARRFPGDALPARSSRVMSPAEVSLLTGRAGAVAQNTNYFVGSVYNGNRAGTIKSLTIYLMPRVPTGDFQGIVRAMDAMQEDRRRPVGQTASSMLPFDDIGRKKQEAEGRLRYYHVDVNIPPLATRSFSVQVLESDVPQEGYEWGISGAEVE